jgi:hypothetical protein
MGSQKETRKRTARKRKTFKGATRKGTARQRETRKGRKTTKRK